MKIQFEIDEEASSLAEIKIYNNKEEWDANPYSLAYQEKRRKQDEERVRSQGHFGGGGGPYIESNREPERYPCVAIEAGERYVSLGPDVMIHYFIYDFKIVDNQIQGAVNGS